MFKLTSILVYILPIAIPSMAQLIFLKAVDRLGTTAYTDYYFCCNYIGSFMQWEYNGQPLSGFRTNNVGDVLFDERPDYTYAATLLSSTPTMDDEAEMDSVLVISFHNGSSPGSFSVTCNSNRNISTVSSQNISRVKNNISKGADIRLDYVFSAPIVHQGPQLSHIFMCGVRQAPQFVEVTELTLGFSASDNVGRARTLFSDDGNTATVQGILMTKDNLMSVALIIVSLEATVVNVTCYDRENIVELPSVEAGSSDNQVITVDGTMETLPADYTMESMQATERPQTMDESKNVNGKIFVTPQGDDEDLPIYFSVSIITTILIASVIILLLLMVHRLFKHR